MKTILAMAAILTMAACSPTVAPIPAGTLPPIQPAVDTALSPSGQSTEIAIQGFAFDPSEITITAGTTVLWTNMDSAPHTITADDGSWGSEHIGKNETFSFTFDQPGTYSYHCNVHPGMIATIIVTAP